MLGCAGCCGIFRPLKLLKMLRRCCLGICAFQIYRVKSLVETLGFVGLLRPVANGYPG